jgi:hypothetical protein
MNEIEKIIQEVDFTTQNIANQPFTPKGFIRYKEKINIYISTLYIEAQKTAIRHKTDNISVNHVNTAASYLVRNHESKISKLLGILGGALLGATISSVLAMTVLGQSFSTMGLVTTIVLGIIGSFLIGITTMKD